MATCLKASELWRIENPKLTNALGQHPAYELRAGHTDISLLAADDPPQRRAGFSAAPLWITAYNQNELYAAGPYPNQSRGGDGLPAYVAQHRRVKNAESCWVHDGIPPCHAARGLAGPADDMAQRVAGAIRLLRP